MKLYIQDETKGATNYVLKNVKECVDFWNREGETVYAKNLTGDLGDKETNEYAKKTEYDDWLLEMILGDCNTFVASGSDTVKGSTFKAGRTRSHVWLHMNNDRVFMIYVK